MEVIYRSKTGFGAPVREWILNDMDDLINDYLGKETITNEVFLILKKFQN